MYQTIVCAIEMSNEGKKVLSKAQEIAQHFDAKLFVTHVISYTLLPKDYQKEYKENIAPKLHKMTEAMGIPKKNVNIKFGKPYEQICYYAEKKKADLVIIGTHSKKGIQGMVGSTANAVSNHAACDVTLIKV